MSNPDLRTELPERLVIRFWMQEFWIVPTYPHAPVSPSTHLFPWEFEPNSLAESICHGYTGKVWIFV